LGLEYAERNFKGEHRVKPLPVRRIAIFLFIAFIAGTSLTWAGPQAKTPVAKAASTPAFSGNAKGIGSPNAPITMEVFGDFECPACRSFYEGTVKQVIDDYVVPGKVYLVHRDFPLDIHPYARQAARLANAAAQLGDFQAMERALYDKQDEWSTKGNIDEVMATSFSPAQMKKFRDYEAAHMNEINASIERDRSMGISRNVNQTPTVYVTAHGKTEALPGGGVDFKLLKNYFNYLLRQ
jgi:protein-disulfide isomerase